MFHTTIHGGQVSLAAAGRGDVAQNVTQTVGEPRTIADVTTQLREWGLPENDIRELEEALTAGQRCWRRAGHRGADAELARTYRHRLGIGAGQVAEGVTVETIVALLTKLVAW